MQEIWSRFETWLRERQPEVLGTLGPGATEEQIARAEQALGVQLPEDVKASFRLHNGQSDDSLGLMDAREFLSLERLQDEWKVWKELLDGGDFEGNEGEPEGPVRADWWNAKWIPLTYDGAGNHDCLDLDPAPGGQVGQVISVWHDDPERKVLAGSFREWFESFVSAVETGRYVFSEEECGFVEADGP